jgi:hypothetical protein
MGFWDSLLGRTRLQKPDMDRLFALPAAGVTLGSEIGLEPGGRAGVCLKPVESGEFSAIEGELKDLASLGAKDFQGTVEQKTDEFGYLWIIFTEADLDSLVNLVHLVGSTLQDKGFGEQLLAAVFRYGEHGGQQTVYLVYLYKRGLFYPLAPRGRERDSALEFRVMSALGAELPMEKDTSRWFPLFDCPV